MESPATTIRTNRIGDQIVGLHLSERAGYFLGARASDAISNLGPRHRCITAQTDRFFQFATFRNLPHLLPEA